MRDADVRRVLRHHIAAVHHDQPETLLVDELGLCGEVRVDLAVVNGFLSGYEIKSACDTLRRLPRQVQVYSRVLDYAHLVVAERHYCNATEHVPEWWGILTATSYAGRVSLSTMREGSRNVRLDPLAMAQLLWRDEALAELTIRGADRGVRAKPRWHIWTRLAATLTVDEMGEVVRARLKARQGWRDAPSPQ